jgi:hypothetical protein
VTTVLANANDVVAARGTLDPTHGSIHGFLALRALKHEDLGAVGRPFGRRLGTALKDRRAYG